MWNLAEYPKGAVVLPETAAAAKAVSRRTRARPSRDLAAMRLAGISRDKALEGSWQNTRAMTGFLNLLYVVPVIRRSNLPPSGVRRQ